MGITFKILLSITILFWIAIVGVIYTLNRVYPFLKPAWSTPLLTDYKPKNGDILLVHYVGHGLHGVPIAESYPTHTAFVYVNEDGSAYALEATRFAAPEQPNVLLQTAHKLSGIRMVPLAHFINAVDSVIYIRELEEGFISPQSVHDSLDWAASLDFETRIIDSMTYDVTIAIGFRLVWPDTARICTHTSKLYETERRSKQVFCSEFVSRLLSRLGALNESFEDHFLMTPASYLSSLPTAKIVPNLESIANKGFRWKPDQMLVRAGADKSRS
jgi:hypothetical protein